MYALNKLNWFIFFFGWAGDTIFKLFSSKDETLLVGRDSFFVLDFGLNIVDRVGRLHLKGDGLASQSLDKDLH